MRLLKICTFGNKKPGNPTESQGDFCRQAFLLIEGFPLTSFSGIILVWSSSPALLCCNRFCSRLKHRVPYKSKLFALAKWFYSTVRPALWSCVMNREPCHAGKLWLWVTTSGSPQWPILDTFIKPDDRYGSSVTGFQLISQKKILTPFTL